MNIVLGSHIFPKKLFRKIILQFSSNNLAEWKKRTRTEKRCQLTDRVYIMQGCNTGNILNCKFLIVI